MNIEANKERIQRYGYEHYNNWNEDLIDELIHPDVTGEYPGFDPKGGIDSYRTWYHDFRRAFPDCHFEIDWLVAEGEYVAVRWDYKATHQGEFLGLPPTGRQIEMKYTSIYRFENGKIREIRADTDTLKLVHQLGYFVNS